MHEHIAYPRVSIITVVYNDIAHIKETMDSVIGQDYPSIEYIIIDGDSTDGTMAYIESAINAVSDTICKDESRFYIEATHRHKPSFYFKFLSQKDNGIYDAMNKGIECASGEWCNFMNCGDRFYTSDTIKAFFSAFYSNANAKQLQEISVIYGDTHIIYDSFHSKILYAQNTSHKYHHRFIHQSAFIRTLVMKAFKYDTHFRIAGDTEFFTRAYNAKMGFMHIPVVVSSFEVVGVSSQLSLRMFVEDCKIGYRYNRLFPFFFTLKYIFYVIPRACIRNIIPKKFRNRARIYFSKKHS